MGEFQNNIIMSKWSKYIKSIFYIISWNFIKIFLQNSYLNFVLFVIKQIVESFWNNFKNSLFKNVFFIFIYFSWSREQNIFSHSRNIVLTQLRYNSKSFFNNIMHKALFITALEYIPSDDSTIVIKARNARFSNVLTIYEVAIVTVSKM